MTEKDESNLAITSLDEKILSSAMEDVASVLDLSKGILKEPNKEKVLYRSCLLAWENNSLSHVPIETPDFKEGTLHERITEICFKAEVRFQKIKLEGEWWKKDCGAMVGFLRSGEQPIALVREKESYYLIDCYEGTKEKVTESNAGNIQPTCYLFYPTLIEGSFQGIEFLHILFKGEYHNLLKALFYFGITLLFGIFFPIANKQFFDTVIPTMDISLFGQLIIGLTVTALIAVIFSYLQSIIFLRIQAIMSSRFQSIQWDLIFRMPSKFFHKYTVGDLLQRMGISQSAWEAMGDNVISMIFSGFVGFVYIIPMAYLSLGFTLYVIVVVIIVFFLYSLTLPRMLDLTLKQLKIDSWINMAELNIFSNVGQIRLYRAEKRAFAYWSDKFAKGVRYEYEADNIEAFIEAGMGSLRTFLNISLFLAFYFFYLNDQQASFSIGTFIGLQSVVTTFSSSLLGSLMSITDFLEVYVSWKYVGALFTETPEARQKGTVNVQLEGNIDVRNVYFRYDEDTDYILENFSLEVKAGEFVALKGKSGAGKTSILRLLANLEKPHEGLVHYEGVEVQHIDKFCFNSQIGIVLQTSDVINGTLHENITLGREVSVEQIHKAAELTGFKKDLDDLPMGLDTLMMMGGNLFSIGQRQKLLLTRALLLDPKVVILDEATSGFYWKDQDLFFEKLRERGKTIIVVSHDNNLIKKADRTIDL